MVSAFMNTVIPVWIWFSVILFRRLWAFFSSPAGVKSTGVLIVYWILLTVLRCLDLVS